MPMSVLVGTGLFLIGGVEQVYIPYELSLESPSLLSSALLDGILHHHPPISTKSHLAQAILYQLQTSSKSLNMKHQIIRVKRERSPEAETASKKSKRDVEMEIEISER
jgi:hypothetical protein